MEKQAMKKIFYSLLLFLALATFGYAQSIGQFKTLRLVNLTDSTSVTPINGSIYYNTQSNKFRAYQAGAWYDLLGGGGGGGTITGATNGLSVYGSNIGLGGTLRASPDTDIIPAVDGTGYLQFGTFSNKIGTINLYGRNSVSINASDGFVSTGITLNGVAGTASINAEDISFVGRSVFFPGTFSGLNTGSLAGDPSTLANGDLWYNSSLNALRARINGATVSLGGGSGTVTSVGSTTTDLTVTNPTTTPSLTVVQAPALRSATTTVNVSSATAPTSGQVLTATSSTAATWQTPSGGGITNTAANNEMAKSDGTNLVPSGIGSNAAGNLQLGGPSGYVTGTDRSLSATGTESSISLSLYHKGSGHTILRGTYNDLYWRGHSSAGLTFLQAYKTSANDAGLTIRGQYGISGSEDGGNVTLEGGDTSEGNGNGGSVTLRGGNRSGSGSNGDIILDVGVNSSQGSTAYVTYGPGSTGSFNITGIVESVLLSGTTLTLEDELHRGKIIYCTSGSGITITVPSGLPLGFNVVIMQDGAGTVTLSASGTTLNGKTSTTGTYDAISLAYYKSSETYIGF